MSKSKLNQKSLYEIKKVKRVMRMKSEGFEPTTFEVYKVSGPNKFRKYFVSRKDAKSFIDGYTDTKMTLGIVKNIMNEIKMKQYERNDISRRINNIILSEYNNIRISQNNFRYNL